jgi:hypothetical protein
LKTRFETLENKNALIFSLMGVVALFIIGNILNQGEYEIIEDIYPLDLLFIITPITVIFLGSIMVLKYGIHGNHSIAWILFTLSFSCWFIAESTFDYEVEYSLENISSFTADIFWISGYPLFLGFTIFYLKPRRKIITKKIILYSSIASLMLLIPTVYFAVDGDEIESLDDIEIFLFVMYPILNAIILVPAIIATILFFKGEVNLLWTMIMFGTVFLLMADTSYLIFLAEEDYYPGHPLDILYIWSYIFYAFGTFSHINLFKKKRNQTLVEIINSKIVFTAS